MAKFNSGTSRVSKNQLRGFQVVSSKIFGAIGGYDEVLRGYGVGGDTDLSDMTKLLGAHRQIIDPCILDHIIEHDNAARQRYQTIPLRHSYLAGMLYRKAKLALIALRGQTIIPLPLREQLFAAALAQAKTLSPSRKTVSIGVELNQAPVGMPRQLGFASGTCTVTLNVTVSMIDPIDQIPD